MRSLRGRLRDGFCVGAGVGAGPDLRAGITVPCPAVPPWLGYEDIVLGPAVVEADADAVLFRHMQRHLMP